MSFSGNDCWGQRVTHFLYILCRTKCKGATRKCENYSLGAGFQDVMAQTTSSIFAMDSYAKLIQNQQETDLSKISSINSEFKGI